jgi:radical SAM protein with 4Fe4S-binding SPASM domain
MSISPKIKFELFRKNQNFCSAPWNLMYVWVDGKVRTCTFGKEYLGNIHDTNIEEILSNPKIKAIKENMLQDVPVKNCQKCLSLENSGDGHKKYSHSRTLYNEQFKNQDVDYTNTETFVLSAVDLHWSSICDLKCVTCWPTQSSSIAIEQGMPIQHTKSDRAHELIDIIVKNQATLKEVYFSGGEPTLIKYNLKLLSQLEKREDLLLRVNSNMMWDKTNEIVKEILKFPNVMFTCSADNLEQKFEYIRRGAVWNKFIDNLNYLSDMSNVKIRINSVFFVLSALDLITTIDYFHHHHKVEDFTINQCEMDHTYLRCRNLSPQIKEQVRSKLKQGKIKYANNLNLVGSFNNCLAELDQSDCEDYKGYFEKIDQLAGSCFDSVFKELV